MLLRLSDSDADHVAAMVEAGLRDAHEDTLSADPEVKEYGTLAMEAALRVLSELDPEAALFGAGLRAGAPFDWDAYYASQDDDEEIETAPLRDDGGVAP